MVTSAKQLHLALPRPPRKTILLALACAAALAGCQPVAPSGGNQDEMYPGSFDPWARVDHLHNDADQQKATEAEQTFASPVGVLSDAVGQDLKALQALQTTVNAANEKLHDTILADLTTSMTWEGLRDTVIEDMGLDSGRYSGPARDMDRDADVTARIILRQEKVAAIAKVLALIADTQSALVQQGNQNASNTATDASSNSPSTPATAAADSTTLNRAQWAQTLLSTVVDAGKQYTQYGQSIAAANAQQEKLLAALNNNQDPSSAFALVAVVGTGLNDHSFDLLDDYLKSLQTALAKLKPPCPVVTAPSQQTPADAAWQNVINSFQAANDALRMGLKVIQAESETRGAAGVSRAGTDWQSFVKFANDPDVKQRVQTVNQAVQDIATQAVAAPGDTRSPAQRSDIAVRSTYRTELASKLVGVTPATNVAPWGQAVGGQPAASSAPNAQHLSVTALRLLGRQQVLLKKLAQQRPSGNAPNKVGNGTGKSTTWRAKARTVPNDFEWTVRLLRYRVEQDLVDVSAHIDSIKSTSSTASRSARLILPNLASKKSKLPALAISKGKNLNTKTNPATSSNQANPCDDSTPPAAVAIAPGTKQSTGFSFLSSILAAQPSLLTTLQKEAAKGLGSGSNQIGLTDADLKFIGSVVNDIDAQAKSANQRLQAMEQDLLQIGTDMNQENLRHTQTLSTIANLEVKRWLALGSLDEDYSSVFDTVPRDPNNPDTYPLFDQDDDSSGWFKPIAYQSGPKGTVAPDTSSFVHPRVASTDQIYPAVIRLLQTARAWHTVSLNDDPQNYALQLDISDQRLYLAVRTIQGHLLMDSLNRKAADDDSVRLVYELALHQNQLDDLHARVEEAGLRLNLGNIRAFNETGITASDIQSIMQAADDVYLGLTVSKVNK